MPRSDDHALRPPTRERLADIADDLGFDLSEAELDDYATLAGGMVENVAGVLTARDRAYRPTPYAHDERPPGRRPSEDPHNAWITRCRVPGASAGPLDGVEVGLKDTIALAGYELTLGAEVMTGFVPRVDATLVTRLLDAGATVTGKQNMEAFGLSGAGDLSDFGPVRNPHDADHLAGGSSSGSAAAVAAGECDAAIGGDQAGSVRVPAAWCGVVGLKPTYGLVPYTGVVPLNVAYDYVGPIAPSVEMAARVLEVVAGEDRRDGLRLDPRQPRGVESEAYTDALDASIDDLTVGVLAEGFDLPTSDPAVDETVRGAVETLADLGADVVDVSAPLHREASHVLPASVQGTVRLLREYGVGTNHRGWHWTALGRAVRRHLDGERDALPPTVKNALLAVEHVERESGVDPYAVAQNLALEAARQYDACLDDADVLALPTTPVLPHERDPSLDRMERVGRARVPLANTALFNLTGHPALTVPCGAVDGLPVGLQLVGREFDERTLLRVADRFERALDWPPN